MCLRPHTFRPDRFHLNDVLTRYDIPCLLMPPSVGGTKDVGDYFKLFDYDIALLVEAIKKTK